jgi:DNA-binding CsgD family transcriptional regulator
MTARGPAPTAPLGRHAELARLGDLLDAVGPAGPSVVVVQGAAGQGKTMLLDWTAGAARERGLRVLRATGVEFERGLAFSGLTAVLRPLLARLDGLTALQAQALRGALGLERSESQALAVYSATLSLLSLVAEVAPVVVVVDDAQWVDPASLEALTFAAHRCDADRVGFVFAQRSGVPCVLDQARFPRLDLAGLDEQAAVDLLAASGVAPAVASRCWLLTLGNPLALIEGARGLTPAQRRGEAPLPAVLPVDDRLLEQFRRELADLPPATLRALGLAALAADGDLGVVAGALAALGGTTDDLGPAEARGIVRLSEGRVEWRHPLLRCAVHEEIEAAERRALHGALAAAAGAAGQDERAVWHLAESVTGPDDAIADRLAATGAAAYRRGALAAATEAYEQASRLAGSAADRDRHLLSAADVRWADGDYERATFLLGPAIDRSTDPVSRAAMAVILGQTETWSSGALRSAERLESHARAVAELAPELSAVLLLHAAMSRMMALDIDLAVAAAAAATAAADRSGDLAAQFGARSVAALAGFFAGGGPASEVAIEPIGQLALAAIDDKDDQGVAVIVALCAYAQLTRGEADAALDLLTRIIDSSDRAGMLARAVLARMIRAEALWRRGRWSEALALMTHLSSLQEATSRTQLRICASAVLARIEAGLGHADECRQHTELTVAAASALGIDHLVAWALSGLGLLELGAGRHAEAAAAFDRVAAAAGHVPEPGFLWWQADAIEAYHGAGRAADARDLLAGLESMAAATGRLWARAAAARCRALLGDGDVEGRLNGSIDDFRVLGAPFEEARTLLVRGEHRLRTGRAGDGARDAALARTIFSRLGARAWSDRASRVRGEAGGNDVSLASQLSPAELRVALAVGEGISNREAAERLYVSTKTIDYHLQNIYRKLGLRSRTQLAALVAAGSADPARVAAR